MKMGKKKLKFKFLFVFLFSVITLGLVSFNTFAFTTNASVGDEITSFTISNFDYNDNESTILAKFSNGYVLGYASGKQEYVLNDNENFILAPFIEQFGGTEQTYEFDNSVTITYLADSSSVNTTIVQFNVVEPTFIESLFEVFSNIGSALMVLINSLIVIFYANNQLTFLGILALCGLGIAIILLILNIISNFLKFRG